MAQSPDRLCHHWTTPEAGRPSPRSSRRSFGARVQAADHPEDRADQLAGWTLGLTVPVGNRLGSCSGNSRTFSLTMRSRQDAEAVDEQYLRSRLTGEQAPSARA